MNDYKRRKIRMETTSTSSYSNFSVFDLRPRNATSPSDVETIATVEIITLGVIFAVSLTSNVAVLGALYARRRDGRQRKLSRMQFFILHLTLADLVSATLNVLPQLLWKMTYRFAGGPALCKVVRLGQTLGPYSISYILVATAVDRQHAICNPLTYCAWSSRQSRTMVLLAWAVSLVFSIPQVTIFSYQEVTPAVHDCWASFHRPWGERVYVTWYSVSVFIVPLCVLVFTYTRICRHVWRSARRHHRHHRGRPRSIITRAKINTIKQTVVVILVYILCSTPFICALLWAAWDRQAYYSPLWTGSTLTILTLLSRINSCVNPWVYVAFNRELSRVLCKCHTHSGCPECGSSSTGQTSSMTSAQIKKCSPESTGLECSRPVGKEFETIQEAEEEV